LATVCAEILPCLSSESYLLADLFTNIVTFRKEDATIQFPTFEAGASGDIRLQFMTTAMDGILLQNTGKFDFIEIRLVCESSTLTYINVI